ncbi:tonb-dependent receptor [hydrocarbon metagenome]|uniref:Tonb-dependent receptor n=1 Tax=hydrocarbon metagenome TaxID=938273 RepID=A0A0W8G061_9ZZZZ
MITGNNQSQVSNNAIEQLAFQVGGYEAKYGQAQSGIINVTTKAGRPNYQIFLEGITSEFTDDYGYNLYSTSLSGPIIPGLEKHTFFASVERGWFQDANPRAKGWNFPSIDKSYKTTPNNDEGVWRYSARTTHMMGDWKVNLGVVGNHTESRLITTAYVKNSSQFFDKTWDENISFSGRVSQTLSSNTFWNLNIGYRTYDFKLANPFFEDDLLAYGDSTRWANDLGIRLPANGTRVVSVDQNFVFSPYGRTRGLYQRREQDAITADFDFTSQIANHLVEFGGGVSFNTIRGYGVFAFQAAGQSGTFEEKMAALEPYVFGYDVTGQNHLDSDFPIERQRPRHPLLAYAYLQDRFELEDLVLNIGLRMDYFDVKSYVLINPALPFAGGTDPQGFDDGDFKIRDADVEFSPRIGLGFPVTESTVFHAQYGRFIQLPRLLDMYAGPYDYNNFLVMEPQSSFNADMAPEETTQYEIGFRQLLGTNAALNITAFYKNIKGLVNVQNFQFQRVEGGEILNSIKPQNSDFGTTKGFAFSLDVTQLSYFNLSAQYTFSIAEGTGSSQSSSQTSVFRNTDRTAPAVIAPLDFDQRHTGVVNIDFFVPKGELGFFELFNANFLLSFSSGRPYTPVDEWNIIGDNGLIADVKGYVNSAYGPSQFRVDMRLEKTFVLGSGLSISPFLWVENLFDTENIVNVWRSTGDPTTTGFLNTESGKTQAAQFGQGYVDDYQSWERTPFNYGIPRLIRLGVKVNFNTFGI